MQLQQAVFPPKDEPGKAAGELRCAPTGAQAPPPQPPSFLSVIYRDEPTTSRTE